MNYDSTIHLETIVTIIYCLLTAFILFVGYRQLKSFTKSTNAQFLLNLYQQFFSEQAIKIITLIHSDCIVFDLNNNSPIFKINISKFTEMYPNRNWGLNEYFTTYEMDISLLNHLDSVGSLVENNVVNLSSAYNDFAWYVTVVFNNKAILEYFNWIDNYEKNSFVFENLKKLNRGFKGLPVNNSKYTPSCPPSWQVS
jgi:hypothetical protein